MRPASRTISLSALQSNFDLAKRAAPNSNIAAVVKANAYGHGAVDCALALESAADCLAVASIDEALELRDAGVQAALLLLEGHFNPGEIEPAAANNFWLMLHNSEQVEQLLAAAPSAPVKVWLKIDSGMHRLGVHPDAVTELYQRLQASANVKEVILASHFANADQPEDKPSAAQTQSQFDISTEYRDSTGAPLSLANSAAILSYPESHCDWIRPGIMLYGSSPFGTAGTAATQALTEQLSAVMTLESEVIDIRNVPAGDGVGYGHQWRADKESIIATIAIGYGDGYPRHARNGTPVLVDNQMATLAGRVSMDLITVDVTGLNNIQRGSKVELWGMQLSVDTVAEHAGTIGYELLTRMPGRTPRKIIQP